MIQERVYLGASRLISSRTRLEIGYLYQALEREAAREADALLCVSRAMAAYVAGEWAVPADKISVVPCCADTAAFDISAACSGFIYALQIADGMLRSQAYRHALVIRKNSL